MFSFFSSRLTRLTSLTLMASTLAVAGSVTVPIVAPCRSISWADHDPTLLPGSVYNFGYDARPGRRGTDGLSGQSAGNQAIRLDGSPVQFNLSGGDAENATDGENAERQQCQYQPQNVRHDLQAANGGNGGHGGNGGNGGNGGSLTVYYADPKHLAQVLLEASGGKGGRGGRAGLASEGCGCQVALWSVEVCQDGQCWQEEYECKGGIGGQDGAQGADGAPGAMGQLVLINQLEPLPSETPQNFVSMKSLVDTPITLSRNLWETRNGAIALLAPGSTVNDAYSTYTGHIERQFVLDWQAPRTDSRFTDGMGLWLESNGEIGVNFPDSYWVIGRQIEADTLTTYRVEGIVPVEDTTRLDIGRVTGRNREFAVNVIDKAQMSDELETEFEVRYSASDDDGRRYRMKYEGPVSSDLIVQEQDRFSLALGRLPIPADALSAGTEARLELVVTRRYGENSIQQTLEWSGRL